MVTNSSQTPTQPFLLLSFSINRMSVQNLNSYDPFADEGDPLGDSADVGSTADYIHIRIQQRNGRKTLTTLQGLPKQYDSKKLLKAFKKEFACNGTLVDDEKMGQVIQLQGDQRAKISTFLVENGLEKSTIKVHGF
jgi:translation initiation factor 1